MNIIVATQKEDAFYCKPDSTLIRSIDKYFIPDYIENLTIAPIIYFKSRRAGRGISERFANRFIETFGYGVMIYPTLKSEFGNHKESMENALDNTTIIPLKSTPIEDYDDNSNYCPPLIIKINGVTKFEKLHNPNMGDVLKRFSSISSLCSIRIGDFVLFELSQERVKITEGDHIVAVSELDTIIDLNIC